MTDYNPFWDDPLHDERQEALAARNANPHGVTRSAERLAAKLRCDPEDIPTASELAEDSEPGR